jgi:hypothetical protein
VRVNQIQHQLIVSPSPWSPPARGGEMGLLMRSSNLPKTDRDGAMGGFRLKSAMDCIVQADLVFDLAA